MWLTFVNSRELPQWLTNKCYIIYSNDKDWFIFTLYEGRDDDQHTWDREFYKHKINRHTPQMRSADVMDYSALFYNEWNTMLMHVAKEPAPVTE